MIPSDTTGWRKSGRRIWRIDRPAIVTYLLVVLAMALLENWLVYPAPPLGRGDWHPTTFVFEEVRFTSADGTKLHGWFFLNSHSKRAILYCHGNGEDVAAVGEMAAQLSESLRASVFVFDYRGYGKSEGRPNEAGCIADGSAAQHWLAQRMMIKPSNVILMGRSLGSAIAVALAAQNGARALVLENAFPTMPDVAALHYPWLPVRWVMDNRFDNLTRIQQYTGPLLQSHRASDELIPAELARRLFDASPTGVKQWLELPGLGHNSPMPPTYYLALASFLDVLSDPVIPAKAP